ncbi:hypothetical protein MGAST_20285 [Mycobacterium gastri 'Wayne']|nr:hypothetical protein MGAST_20285 [Mycobacterium gastri 'Wayne']
MVNVTIRGPFTAGWAGWAGLVISVDSAGTGG